jgi:hypothetical protein
MAYLYLTPHPNPLPEGEGAWKTHCAGTYERKKKNVNYFWYRMKEALFKFQK